MTRGSSTLLLAALAALGLAGRAAALVTVSGPDDGAGAPLFDEVVTPESPGTVSPLDAGRRGQWLLGDELDLVANAWELRGRVTLTRPDAALEDLTKVRLAVDLVRHPDLPFLPAPEPARALLAATGLALLARRGGRATRGSMRTLIEGYEIVPGEHCGSAAMRGLLKHYCGLALPEPAVFGLAAGLECAYLESPALVPGAAVFGRTATLELDLGRILGVDYRELRDPDDEHAWQAVREEVLAGRPTMLSGDVLYLDYREFKVHFPGHRFVLLGFDDASERAFVADRIRPELEACSYAALRKSRNPPEGLSTQNLWGRFHGTEVGRPLRDAARLAIRECAERMLGKRTRDAAGFGEGAHAALGVAGIRRLAQELPRWSERPDARELAGFNARCIEKFGNGGGNFRRLYAGFLAWARALDPALAPADAPALATRAADGWTALSELLFAASAEGAPAAPWADAAALAWELAEVEQALFERLAA